MTYLTEREINVIGIQRTGQHAISSWLIGHFDSVCYKNNMSQLGVRARSRHGIQKPFWYFQPKERDEWEVSHEMEIRSNQDAIILGTEFSSQKIGLNPNLHLHKERNAKITGFDEFSKRQDHILVLRNPYNHYASVLNWSRNKFLSPADHFSNTWIKMANECVGHTDLLPSPKTMVNYDLWFTDKNYRVNLSEQLGLVHTDRRLNTVMKIGIGRSWGSSFDGMKKNNKAQNMDVLHRWKTVKDNPRFIKLCKNEELVDIARDLGWEKPL